MSITDSEGRTRIRLDAEGNGAFVRLLDAAGNERLTLSCAPTEHLDSGDESAVQIQLNRRDGSKSIAIRHEDEYHHGDRQSLSFTWGGESDADRLSLSSLWFGAEAGAELRMNDSSGRPLVQATTGAFASHPRLMLHTYDTEGANGRWATVARWLQMGQVSVPNEDLDAMGVLAGQDGARAGFGVEGEASAFVSAQDERGAAALVPGR